MYICIYIISLSIQYIADENATQNINFNKDFMAFIKE